MQSGSDNDLIIGLVEAGGPSSDPSPSKKKNPLSKLQWALIITLVLGSIAVGVAYGVIVTQIEKRVKDANEVCSSDDPGADLYDDPASQEFRLFFYNISNPMAVVAGEQAELHELGSYYYTFQNHRYNVQYHDSDDTVSSRDW